MAKPKKKPRKKVPETTKRTLRNQTGGKCANPGCLNRRLEDHHIKEWVVYQTNDEKDMIAICPACHDAVHHGELEIDDETIRRWKRLTRRPVKHDILNVEPGPRATLIFGNGRLTSDLPALNVFALSEGNKLSFYVDENDFFLMDFALTAPNGTEIIRMRHNRLIHTTQHPVTYLRNPGHIRIAAPRTPEFAPKWVDDQMESFCSHYSIKYEKNDEFILLDLEVIEPSVVRFLGYCVEDSRAVVATPEGVFFVFPQDCYRFDNIGIHCSTMPKSVFELQMVSPEGLFSQRKISGSSSGH